MTLRHLKIFVSVCECGGTTKASELLHIAQPSISHTISEMEKYYNVALFDRINQRLVITEIGRQLLVKAKEILANFDDFENLATNRDRKSIIRIGASLTLGQTIIPKYLKKLKETIPEIIPKVIIDKTAMIEKELESGNLDFGIVEGEIYSPHLEAFELSQDKIIAVASNDYPTKDIVSLEDFIKNPLLLREKGSTSRTLFDHTLHLRNMTAKPFLESVSNQCIISSVKAGLGVSVLPEGLVNPLIDAGLFKMIKIRNIEFKRTHYITLHKRKKLNSMQQSAFELCQSFSTL